MKKKIDTKDIIDRKKSSMKYIFVIYAIVMIVLFSFLTFSLFDVGCGVSLNNDTIEYGQNVTLNYHITNNLFFVDLNDVVFQYWIEQNNSVVLNETKINLLAINSFNSYENNVIVPTYRLDRGKYTIWTQITYSKGEGRKGIGNREAKLLSWDISIV